MIENLVIVESPAKAKTIEKFLGNGYTVKSSFGHIRDLEKKDLGVDIAHHFQPKYEISSDKKTVVILPFSITPVTFQTRPAGPIPGGLAVRPLNFCQCFWDFVWHAE